MTIKGSCHCGNVAFEIDGAIPDKLTRCTCSFCAKRGALLAYYPPQKFKLTSAHSAGIYRWNSRQVAHYFCMHCGVPTHSDSPAYQRDRSWDGKTRRFAANARLFDDFDAATAPVEVIDGKHLW